MTSERQPPGPAGDPWWKNTTVYHVYPRSFSDSNGDGIGDLPGVLARLDYLHDLGVETIWLSPFFRSPQGDFGYDITDHTAVDPSHGSMDDFHRLVDAIHERGMKVVLDTVLNHTSIEHPWFIASRSSREHEKRDWYIWRDGARRDGKARPNNWRNLLGGRGWHFDAATGQWYWASFLPFQPDLNWRNPEVKDAMLGVVRHWLDRGVDGLRLDIFNALYKDASFADNPLSLRPIPSEVNPEGFFQRPIHTLDHPDTIAFSRELRSVVDAYGDPQRFVVGEVMGSFDRLREYCGAGAEGLHLVFMFETMRTHFSASGFRELIAETEAKFAAPLQPTWVFSNHDRPRAIHRLGDDPDKARLLAMLQLTVRGVPFIYYGEELGLSHVEIPPELGLDPIAARFAWIPHWLGRRLRGHGILLNRDECRLPMPWSEGKNAGFTPEHVVPWLPLHPDSGSMNVDVQRGDPRSVHATYRRLLRLRREHPALYGGSLELVEAEQHPRPVLAYRRVAADEVATVLLNFSERPVEVDLPPRVDSLHSNTEPDPRHAGGRYTLGAYEGVVAIRAVASLSACVDTSSGSATPSADDPPRSSSQR
ncbi:MAG: DUF3459 domain-containing protein [Myxococcales bacterium]|nr:DUF3459 domain-containing protein [Myxococcales bacterium]